MSTYTEDCGWRVLEGAGDGIVQRDIYLARVASAYLRHHRPPAELNPELLAYFRSFA